MQQTEAQRAIESLRKGLPAEGFVRQFTVGRESEMSELTSRLDSGEPGTVLLEANYGAGKTHLLQFVRETALSSGYAVSLVTLDSQSAVRFNRMDQILGAVWRGLEIPKDKQRGVRPFLDLVCREIDGTKASGNGHTLWQKITNGWKWDYSDALASPAMFIAVRAWATGRSDVRDLIEDWLLQPADYQARRKDLYEALVLNLRANFRDPRPDWKFYDNSEGVFNFQRQEHSQSWSALRDMHDLACAAGLKGLVILFDEFEDVIHNLKGVNYQEAAFWNLFEFYSGKKFESMSFFAVTPDFAAKCKTLLMDKGRWDYDYSLFENLPRFQMSPLTTEDLQELAIRIMECHGLACGWEPDLEMKMSALQSLVQDASSAPMQDRARFTIREIVKFLDQLEGMQ